MNSFLFLCAFALRHFPFTIYHSLFTASEICEYRPFNNSLFTIHYSLLLSLARPRQRLADAFARQDNVVGVNFREVDSRRGVLPFPHRDASTSVELHDRVSRPSARRSDYAKQLDRAPGHRRGVPVPLQITEQILR